MIKSVFRFTLILALAGLAGAGTAAAQEFQKSYRIDTGGSVRIANVSGDVTVTGYDGNAIVVTANKKGRDSDQVDIEDRSSANAVDVIARYPKNCNCDASISFTVQVPRSVSLDFKRISSVSGDVRVSNVTGKVHASSVSGKVSVKEVNGSVNASAVSGDVEVEINQLEGADPMKFSTVSGDVSVRIPSGAGADVDMSTFSGNLRTDFPLEVKKERYTSSRSVRGRVGDGTRRLRISSVSGDLNLLYSSR